MPDLTKTAADWDELLQMIEEERAAGAGRVWLAAIAAAAGRDPRPPFHVAAPVAAAQPR